MALFNIPEGQSVFSMLTGLDASPEDQEATLRSERIKTLRQQKYDYLTNSKADKEARFGYDVDKSVQENVGEAFANHQVYTDQSTGQAYQQKYINGVLTKIPYNGATRDLYIGEGGAGDIKLGLARNDVKPGYDSYQARYMDKSTTSPYTGKADAYDGTPGPYGVNPTKDKALAKITLPYDYATQLEYGVHTDIDMLKSRAMGPNTPQDASTLYGGGKNEYYLKDSPLTNDRFIAKGLPFVTKDAYNMELEEPRYDVPFDKPLNTTFINNQNTIQKIGSAFGAGATTLYTDKLAPLANQALGAVAKGVINNTPAGAALNLYDKLAGSNVADNVTQAIDKSTADSEAYWREMSKDGKIDKLFNYHPEEVQAMGNTFKDNVKKGEYYEAIKGIASNPETAAVAFSNSIPEMAVMMTGIGLGTMVAANINKDQHELEESAKAKGITLTTLDRAKSMGLSTIGTLLDRFGDKVMLGKTGIPGVFKPAAQRVADTITTTLGAMTPVVRNAVLARVGGTLADIGITTTKIAGKTAVEGATEGMQEILQGKASNIDKLNKLTSLSQQEIDQALVATGIGLGAGGIGSTMSSAPDIKNTAINTGGTLVDITNAGFNKLAKLGHNITEAGQEETKARNENINNVRTNAQELYNQSKLNANINLGELYTNNNQSYINAMEIDEKSHKLTSKVKNNIINNLSNKNFDVSTVQLGNENTTPINKATAAIDMIEDLYTHADIKTRNNLVFLGNLAKVATMHGVDQKAFNSTIDDINIAQEAGVIESNYGNQSYKHYGRLLRQAVNTGDEKSIAKLNNTFITAYKDQITKLNNIQNIVDNINQVTDFNSKLEAGDPNIQKLKSHYVVPNSKNKFGHPTKIFVDTNGNIDANTAATIDILNNSITSLKTEYEKSGLKSNITTTTNNTNKNVNTTNKAIDYTAIIDSHKIDISIVEENKKEIADAINASLENLKKSKFLDIETSIAKINKTKQKAGFTVNNSSDTTKTSSTNNPNTNTTVNNTSNTAKQSPNIKTTTNTHNSEPVNKKIDDDNLPDNINVDEETKTVIKSAGYGPVVQTLKDKVKSINIELLNKHDVRAGNASNSKGKSHNHTAVGDTIIAKAVKGENFINDLLALSNSKSRGIPTMIQRVFKKVISGKNSDENTEALQYIAEQVKDALANSTKAREAIKSLFGPRYTKQQAIKVVTMAIATTHATSVSTFDIKEEQKLNNDNEISQAPKQEVAMQLGKIFMNSADLRIAGEQNEVAKAYVAIGEKIIIITKEAGLIEEHKNTHHPIPSHLVDQNNKPVTVQNKSIKDYYEVIDDNIIIDTINVTGTLVGRDNPIPTITVSKTFNSLFIGSNLELPSNEFETSVHSNYQLTDKHKAIIKAYQKLKYKIRPEFINLLKAIKSHIIAYGDIDTALRSSNELKRLLTLLDSRADIKEATEKGKAIGKSSKLLNLIDNLEYLIEMQQDGFHFHYDSAINQRIHVMETVLDYQGDKYMARQMLTGGEKALTTDIAKRLLLNTIASELKWSIIDIAKVTGIEISNVSPDIEALATEKQYKQMEIGMNLAQKLSKGKSISLANVSELNNITKHLKMKSPFKVLSLLSAMNDIKQSEGKVIKTSYPVEIDAIASGIVNTLLNLAGYPAVQRILKQLGIGKLNSKNVDPYTFVDTMFKTNHESSYDDAKPFLAELNEIGIDNREVAKYAIMKWFYGQSNDNNNADMAIDIVDKVLDEALYENNQNALKLINDILNLQENAKYTFDRKNVVHSIRNISKEHLQILQAYYADNLTHYYTTTLEALFEPVTAYRKQMERIYDLLEKSGHWEGSINTAIDKLTETDKPMKASLKKLKQYVFKEDILNEVTGLKERVSFLSNKAMNNKNSFKVNLQHMVDAAILLMTLKDVMDANTLAKIEEGLMSVHDAIYANAETALLVIERYNYYAKEVALKYDFMEVAIQELIDVKNKETDPNKQNILQTHIDEFTNMNDKIKAKKEIFLRNIELNIAGNEEIGNQLAVEKYNSNDNNTIKKEVKKASYTLGSNKNINENQDPKETLPWEDPISQEELQEKPIEKDPEEDPKEESKETLPEEDSKEEPTKAESKETLPKEEPRELLPWEDREEIKKAVKEVTNIRSILNELQNLASKHSSKSSIKVSKIVQLLQQLKLDISETHQVILDKIIQAIDSKTNSKDRVEILTDKIAQSIEAFKGTTGWSGVDMIITIPSRANSKSLPKTADALVEILGHEIDHAIQLKYIMTHFNKKNLTNAQELRYLNKVVDKLLSIPQLDLLSLSRQAKDRLNYIRNVSVEKDDPDIERKTDALRISEFSSIIMNEPKIAEEIMSLFPSKNILTKVIESVKLFMKKVNDFFNMLTSSEIDNLPIQTNVIINALLELDNNARAEVMNQVAKDLNIEPSIIKPANFDDSTNKFKPLNVISDSISAVDQFNSDWIRMFGSTLNETISPTMVKAHTKLKYIMPIYRDVSKLLKTGFYDSELAQKMHYILGFAGDVTNKVIKKALTMFSSYNQEVAKDLEFMAQMDRQINSIYNKKDRITLHKLFADTGIANLGKIISMKNELFSGSKTVANLITELTVKISPTKISKLDEVVNEMIYGNSKSNFVNLLHAESGTNEEYMYVTLKAIAEIDNGENILTSMDTDLRDWMLAIALSNKKLSEQINNLKYSNEDQFANKIKTSNTNYSETYAMDMHESIYEYKSLSINEMKDSKYSSDNDWVVIHNATGNKRGLVARENFNASSVAGIGLGANRFFNGAFLNQEQSKAIDDEISTMSVTNRKAWLKENRFIKEDGIYRVLIEKQVKVDKLGLIQNAAHSLYRTYIHNKELIQTESIRQLMLAQGTEQIKDATDMKKLEDILRENDRVGLRGKIGTRTEVKPLIKIDYSALDLQHIKSFNDLKYSYPMIAKYFKTAERNTSFNNFSSQVSLVKRGVSDVIQGHKNFSLFGSSDFRSLAKAESMFKKMVILAKQKLVVTNPVKLAKDSISNVIMLELIGVSTVDIIKGFSKGLGAYKEYAKERSKYVSLTMDATIAEAVFNMDNTPANKTAFNTAIAKRNTQLTYLSGLEFHDAFNYGFVQSYSTDLVIKEFDTISGIQQDIDKFVNKYTHDKKGDPNKLFKAIKWWQNIGFGMDDVFKKMGEIAGIRGTDIGTEFIELAERLKNKKADKESVARYISDYTGSPSSELVNYGSAYMVLSDSLSKYTLAKHLMTIKNPKQIDRSTRTLYTKEEAYTLANETFVDYRTNLPAPIKALSDYGILMFPNFWMKIQKVIFNLAKHHPVSTGVSYGISSQLNIENMHPLDQAVFLKYADSSPLFFPGETIDAGSAVIILGG